MKPLAPDARQRARAAIAMWMPIPPLPRIFRSDSDGENCPEILCMGTDNFRRARLSDNPVEASPTEIDCQFPLAISLFFFLDQHERKVSEMPEDEVKDVEEEEEELDCSSPEVVNKYQFAGQAANGELRGFLTLNKPAASPAAGWGVSGGSGFGGGCFGSDGTVSECSDPQGRDDYTSGTGCRIRALNICTPRDEKI